MANDLPATTAAASANKESLVFRNGRSKLDWAEMETMRELAAASVIETNSRAAERPRLLLPSIQATPTSA